MRDPATIATFFIFTFSLPRTTEKSHRQRSLAGYNPKGHKELDTTKLSTRTHTATMEILKDTLLFLMKFLHFLLP